MSDAVKIYPPVTSPAQYRPPKNACNVHAHVFGPYSKFPDPKIREFTPAETPFEMYLKMHEVLGFDRGVLTQPTHYGIDNACMLDAIGRSNGTVKGIVALDPPALTDKEVARLDGLGVRGVRINDRVTVGPRFADIEAVAERIKGAGWHIELVAMRAIDSIVALRARIEKVGVPVMVDGMGAPQASRGLGDPSFQAFVAMVRDGVIWTKLSHPYHMDEHPYPAVTAFAQALVDANIKRCVFGLDWPHPGEQPKPPMPDDGFLLDLFPKWVPDEKNRHTILVDNPAEIFRF